MTLRDENYKARILDEHLARLLRAFGAVEVVGSMWCGKTWMADAHGNSKISLANASIKEIVEADTSLAFEGVRPHIIDEWQEIPRLWDDTRLAVDAAAGKRGLYILTGSSTPAKDEVTHSGTGRIARIHLRPMSLFESGESSGRVSLSKLFEGVFKQERVTTDLRKLASSICRGGWPGLLMLDNETARLIPAQYLDTLISSIARKHETDEYRLRRLLASLARNIGQAVTYDTTASDMVEGDIKDKRKAANRQQVEKLISMTKDRFIIEDQCGWDAPIRSKSRVRIKPVRRFVDPSLAASLLGANEERLLSDSQLFGRLFEELCLRDLRIYASAMELSLPDPVRYYRDSDNLEVDAIIELRDGRWAALEIKLGENKVDEGVANLLRLKEKVAANPLARNPEPSFMAVVAGKLEFCRKTPKGVFVIPITSLTA